MFLRYDGSFEGFLSAAAAELRTPGGYGILRPDARIPLLPVQEVATDSGLADRMGPYLASRLGPEVPATVYRAWLSQQEGIEDALVGYLRTGLSRHVDPSGLLQVPEVETAVKASRRVEREAHRFLGLVRFRLRGPLYVAEIEPDTDILPLLGAHFAERFHDQRFAIHDLRHGKAILHLPEGGWDIVPCAAGELGVDKDAPVALTATDAFEAMWKRYFKVMAIEERINPERQRGFLPKKHWRHLVEEPGRPPESIPRASDDRR